MSHNQYRYSKKDILLALEAAGLQNGDSAYFSTSLGMLGVAENINTQDELNSLYFECFKESLGDDGNIFVPTYSYTFGGSTKENPKIFDPQKTPAEIGPFPNFFLKQKGVIRSLDPMVSIAGLGPRVSQLVDDLPHTSYGRDSLYERFLSIPRMKAVSVGLGPNWTPFIHYADYLNQVPFRYDKLFYGGIQISETKCKYAYWLYSVKARIAESWADAHRLGKMAVEAGIWKFAPLGRARVYVCSYQDYFEFAMRELKKDVWLQARGPKVNVVEKEGERLRTDCSEIELHPDNWLIELKQIKRNALSFKTGDCTKALSKLYGFELFSVVTGENYYDFIVPEIEAENESEEAGLGRLYLADKKENAYDEKKKDVLICAYLNDKQDKLEVLERLLRRMKETQDHFFETHNLRLALLPLPLSLAAYIDRLNLENRVDILIHLTDQGLELEGRNPISNKRFLDTKMLHFNLEELEQIRSTDIRSKIQGLI